jgi:hypothetical protein
MPAPVGTVLSNNAAAIEEQIDKDVNYFMGSLDPVFEDLISTSEGVGQSSALGRHMEVRKLYQPSGVTGVIEPAGPKADFSIYGEAGSALGSMTMPSAAQTFPDALAGPEFSTLPFNIPMRGVNTNLRTSLGEMQADALPATISQIVAPKLMKFARHLSHMTCLYWYLSQNSFYALTSLIATNWAFQDGNSTVEFDLKNTNMAIDRFMRGMRIQIYSSDGSTLRQTASLTTNTILIVTSVDEGKCTFKAKAVNGAADLNGMALAANDVVVPALSKGSASTPNSASPYFTGFAGFNSYLKGGTGGDDNFLLGAERVTAAQVDVTQVPEFASLVFNRGGLPLNEHYLRQVLRRFHSAKGKYGMEIDTLIAAESVWLSYEQQRIQRQWFDRTGKLADLSNEGGPNKFKMVMDGKTYNGVSSTYAGFGELYGVKVGGSNWKCYSPPNYGGLSQGKVNASKVKGFNFVAQALGQPGILMPMGRVSGSSILTTESASMPGKIVRQIVPDQPVGIKITGIADDRIFSL